MFLPPLFRTPKYKVNTMQYAPRKLEVLDHWSLVDKIIRACYRRRTLQGRSPGKWLQTYWGPWWLLNLFSYYQVVRILDRIIKMLRTPSSGEWDTIIVPFWLCFTVYKGVYPGRNEELIDTLIQLWFRDIQSRLAQPHWHWHVNDRYIITHFLFYCMILLSKSYPSKTSSLCSTALNVQNPDLSVT